MHTIAAGSPTSIPGGREQDLTPATAAQPCSLCNMPQVGEEPRILDGFETQVDDATGDVCTGDASYTTR